MTIFSAKIRVVAFAVVKEAALLLITHSRCVTSIVDILRLLQLTADN